ncbi:MAG: META domain-containing protein [Pseudomonadota bacterium]
MIRALAALGIILAMAGCQKDETIAGFTTPDTVWNLELINDTPVEPVFTIQFAEDGRTFGQADCNRFTSVQSAPYPWFDLGPIAVTKALCLNNQDEGRYILALDAAETVEIAGDVLLITGPEVALTFRSGSN